MATMQMPPQPVTTNMVEAIWALVQCQSKSVQRALAKRFAALGTKQPVQSKADTINPELQARLDASRKDIEEGRGVVCRSKNELQSFLAAL